MSKPLLTYVVASYNQQAFIRDALESAFAQTYTPLEIIISDDCSKDATFEIAQEMAAAYRGPHQLRLNRNSTNVGISGQVNRVMQMAQGALAVATAADDISLPHRTQVIYDAWEASGRRATSIFSSYTIISGDGKVVGAGGLRGEPGDTRPFRLLSGSLRDFLATKLPVVNGCTHAWSPVLFSDFGPLISDLEDLVLSFRSLAIGQLLYIHEPLVKYRRHESNVSFLAEGDDTRSFEHREKRLRWVDEKTVLAYENMLADIDVLCRKGRLADAEAESLRAEARKMRNLYALERRMMEGTLLRRVATLAGAAGGGDFKNALRFTPRALPRPVYRALYILRERRRAQSRRPIPA